MSIIRGVQERYDSQEPRGVSVMVNGRHDETEPSLLERLQRIDPRALLVPSRLLRRIIKKDRGLGGLGLQVPHRRSYWIGREALLRLTNHEELGVSPEVTLPETLLLLASPRSASLAGPTPDNLLRYWRTLFHVRVHAALENRFDGEAIAYRLSRLGEDLVAEARTVLNEEDYLLPPADDGMVYAELAAVYLELLYFAPALLPHFFPTIAHTKRLEDVLRDDLDADALFASTRPAGAPNPTPIELPAEESGEIESDGGGVTKIIPAGTCEKWANRAELASRRGNHVRAALSLTSEGLLAAPEESSRAMAAARREIEHLVSQLQPVLGLSQSDLAIWRRALAPLLTPGADGFWAVEARLLYDLQKASTDLEQDEFQVRLLRWLVTFGKKPLRQHLPRVPEVHVLKHLRSAARRLRRARIKEPDRHRLAGLLDAAIIQTEEAIRKRLRPCLVKTLEEVGLQPQNLPEQVSRSKLIEEMLDRVCERYFLTMGDLRDAISRNNLKLPDVGHGKNQLLAADRRLGHEMTGVYRSGEVYLRGLQGFSALTFGTRAGRWLTRFVALPFGGAFVVLEGVQHVTGHLIRAMTGVRIHLMTPWSVGVVGVFILALLHWADFRHAAARLGRALLMVFWWVLVEVPTYVFDLPILRRVLASKAMLVLRRYLLQPLIPGGLVLLAVWDGGSSASAAVGSGLAVFLGSSIFFNTQMGRHLEEAAGDWLVRGWQKVQFDFLPRLFHFVMELFKRLGDEVDRALYAVDEWLRYRSGEGMLALVLKATVGPLWAFVVYVVRFSLNLLIEPQINPIKHFPVVTVSHKLILATLLVPLSSALAQTMDRGTATTVAAVICFSIPGIFGFFVWELKENWKLYTANRPKTLRPVVVGHHGETIDRLLRPGFHSGTLPKLFARLRRTERIGFRTGDWRAARSRRETLHQVAESIEHFVERDLVGLLMQCKSWPCLPLAVECITLTTNRIQIDLEHEDYKDDPLTIIFTELGSGLTAAIRRPTWMDQALPEQRWALDEALKGFLQLAGAHPDSSGPERPAITWEEWVATWQHGPKGQTQINGSARSSNGTVYYSGDRPRNPSR